MHSLFVIASTESSAHTTNLFAALGINWVLLVEQSIAFLVLVGILAKFVYPPLMKSIDARREQIEAGMKEAKEAGEALERAEAKVADMLADARKEADEMIARTQQEANSIVAEAEDKAKARADQIVADARQQLDIDVAKARAALKKDTIDMVAMATERIIGEKLDSQKDAELVKKALDGGEA